MDLEKQYFFKIMNFKLESTTLDNHMGFQARCFGSYLHPNKTKRVNNARNVDLHSSFSSLCQQSSEWAQ